MHFFHCFFFIYFIFSACAYGWMHFSNGCYKHFPNGKSWKRARCSCKFSAPDNDGDLASVPNQETNDFLSKLATGNFWVGGYRNTFNEWSWSDGTPWTFESWSKGQPDDNRGYEDYVGFVDWNGEKGKWNDFSCEGRDGLSYMCHYPVKGTFIIYHVHCSCGISSTKLSNSF